MFRLAAVRQWSYHPAPARESRDRTPGVLRPKIAAALRAGHSAGARFTLSVPTGPRARTHLSVPDASSARWVVNAFAPAFDGGHWKEEGAGPDARVPHAVWAVRRIRSWPEALRSPADAGALLDAVELGFRTVSSGATVSLAFRPIRAEYAGSPALEVTPTGSVRRPGAPTSRFERPIARPVSAPEVSPLWRARAMIYAPEDSGGPSGVLEAASRALSAAALSANGNGLRCRRLRRWSWSGPPEFDLSECELALVVPGVLSPAEGVEGDARAEPGDLLPLGRDSQGRVVGPVVEPSQGRHLAILGETGMGKSSLLIALARRIAARAGLVLFDPVGDTAAAVLREIPARERGRVVWVAPGTGPGLNALAGAHAAFGHDTARSERELNDLVHALRRVRSGRYPESSYWGPRLEEMLTRALRTAAAVPGGTLEDAHRLLSSGGRGFHTLPPAATDPARELADRIRSRPEDVDGALRLLHEVTRSTVLCRMLCDPHGRISARDLVTPGRIALISGEAATVGETVARYLLSVYLALVWSELLARPERTKTYLLLDEAQWFAHESLAEMLRLGRRANVHTVFATQAVASLPGPVAEAAWTNVADFVAFRGSVDEARELARFGREVGVDRVLSLPRGEAAVLIGKGGSVRWIRTTRIPRVAEPVGSASAARCPDGAAEDITIPAPSRIAGRESDPPVAASSLDGVVDALRRLRPDGASFVPYRVSLRSLRAGFPPATESVRTAGSWLRQQGVIVRVDHDVAGTHWWIDPGRLPAEPNPASCRPFRSAEYEAKS